MTNAALRGKPDEGSSHVRFDTRWFNIGGPCIAACVVMFAVSVTAHAAETPTVGLVVPRVTQEGTLRSVTLVNARIDEQKPVTLRLRGVPSGVESVTWRVLRCTPQTLPVERVGGDCLVHIPALSAWNCGWAEIGIGQ